MNEQVVYNGMPGSELPAARWQRSRRSGSQGNCVELAELPTGEIALRNSQQADGPVLVYTRAEIAALVNGAKDGDFDNFL